MNPSPSAFVRRVVATVAVAGCALSAPAGQVAAAGRPGGPLAPATGVLFGAHVQKADGSDPLASVVDLENRLGRRFALDHYYRPFTEPFPDGREQWDFESGRIPMISWGKAPAAEVNAGTHDDLIRQRARDLAALGQPVMVRWFWEMGGNRNAAAAGSPAAYVAAWRRLFEIFAAEGTTNAVWVWCPDASDFVPGPDGVRVAEGFYPGDDVVDWTCADGYNFRHPSRRSTQPRSFEDTFAAFYDWALARGKPIMIGETGVVEDGPGAKAAWVDSAREVLQTRFPAVAAFVYFHSLRERDGFTYDWRMDTSDTALSAFAAMGADPWFNPEVVRTLPDTIIDNGPAGAVGRAVPPFTFSATEEAGGFECALDGAPFASCTSPVDVGGLVDGPHRFMVRALGRIGRFDPTPAAREWTVDTVAPTVTETRPADGATAVALRDPVTVTFSEDVDPARLVPGSFRLVHQLTGRTVAGRLSYDAGARSAVFVPGEDLLPASAYQAHLAAAAVADPVGNSMDGDVIWSFTTGGLPLPEG